MNEMVKEICVIGHPSYLGGADTELFDQIKCWSWMGIKVYILHTGSLREEYRVMHLEDNYNCTYLEPGDYKQTAGFHCISFCNGKFLENIAEIKKYAISTTFVNCMTWNFYREVEAQRQGLIDFHLYQTRHGYERVSPKLIATGKPFRYQLFKPHFDTKQFVFYHNRPDDRFRFGRLSRNDSAKYHVNQFRIYDSIDRDDKAGLVLGWSDRIQDKCHIDKSDLVHRKLNDSDNEGLFYKNYVQLMEAKGYLQKIFYQFCDVLILQSDTFENLPRTGFECMASGTIPVVDNRGGWTLEIDHGYNGYLCNNTQDFITYSNKLANDSDLRNTMRINGMNKLKSKWSLEESSKDWEIYFKRLKEYETHKASV